MKKVLLSLFVFVLQVQSQNSILLKDIQGGTGGSNPANFIEINGKTIFTASDPSVFVELFISDGTEQGTTLLKDINPTGASFPNNFIFYNNKVYFSASNGLNGVELWVTDGTSGGTSMVKDINVGSNSSNPAGFVLYNNRLFFSANTFVNGNELWTSDGTSIGTFLVKDINSPGSSNPGQLTVLNNKLMFRAFTSTNGTELWVSDGTDLGTQMVKDIFPGNGSSGNSTMIVYHDTLYFGANNNINGNELWASDGTSAGTFLVKDINTGLSSSNPANFYIFKNKLFFSGLAATSGNELWVTDGSTTGTILFADIALGGLNSAPSLMFEYNNKMFFAANDGINGVELWMSDTFIGSTLLFKDINPGVNNSFPNGFIVFNNELFFIAQSSGSNDVYKLTTVMDSVFLILPYPNIVVLSPHTAQGLRVCNGSIYFTGNYTVSGTEPYIINYKPKLFLSALISNSFAAFKDSLSNSEIFTIKGFELTDSIVIQLPYYYEATKQSATIFSNRLVYKLNGYNFIDSQFSIRFRPIVKGATNGEIKASTVGIDTIRMNLFGIGFTIPTVLINSNITDSFLAFIDSISSSKKISIKGNSLNGPIKIYSPAYYKISADNFSFNDSLVLIPNADSVTLTDIYIKFYPNKEGIVKNNLLIQTLGVAPIYLSLTGFGKQKPFLFLLNSIVDTFTSTVYQWSNIKSFELNGKGIISDITIQGNSNFLLSNDSNDFSSQIKIIPNNGEINNYKIFIRFKSDSVGVYQGNITITNPVIDTIKMKVFGRASKKLPSQVQQIGSMLQIISNPIVRNLEIQFRDDSKNYLLRLYNCNGQLIKILNSQYQQRIQIDISQSGNGIYFLEVHDELKSEIYKVIILD